MTKYIHAELMMQYAQDAMETDEPWLRWEILGVISGLWFTATGPLGFQKELLYRRKQKTININGYEVPEPVSEKPEVGTKYFTPSLTFGGTWCCHVWQNDAADKISLSAGIVHLTGEAAKLHAEALLSFTKEVKNIKPSIDWDEVGECYNWLAVDKDGRGFLFISEPTINEHFSEWGVDTDECVCVANANEHQSYKRGNCDWRDSLVKRQIVD